MFYTIDMKLAKGPEPLRAAMARAVSTLSDAFPNAEISHKDNGRAGSAPRYLNVETDAEAKLEICEALKGAGFKTEYTPRYHNWQGHSVDLILAR